jgi:type I restriction enzyme M protein
MMKNADMTHKLIALAKFLLKKDIPIHAYLTELTWLLFLKIAPFLGETIPAHLNWDSLISKQGKEQYEHYKKILKELEQYATPHIAGLYTYADTAFKNPEQLAQVITTIAAVNVPIDEQLGDVFEILLEKCRYEDAARLYMAPRSLTDLMVILTQPKLGELIQDPLAGTASFVIAADQYIQVTSDEELDKKNSHPPFIAIEPDLVQQRLALMNCLLHQIDHPQHVRWGDSLLSNLQTWPQADVILSMLLFASESNKENHESSLALLQHIYLTLKPGGRAAIIVPDEILKARGEAKKIRTTLLDTCVLHTVLRLPNGLFYPHKINAHLLFFKKGERTKNVWFYDLRTHNVVFGQLHHLTREHLKAFENVYGDDPNGQSPRNDEGEKGRWRCFNRDALAKQNNRFDLCWLQEVETEKNHFVTEKTRKVLSQTIAELETITEILRDDQ